MNSRLLAGKLSLIIVAFSFGVSGFSQENMQRRILGAGMLIGINETLLEQEVVTERMLQRVDNNREALLDRLDGIIREYRTPFDNSALKDIRKRVQEFDVFSDRMNNRHKAKFFYKTYSQMKLSLAMTFGSRRGERNNLYAEPTCDSALLDLAYHFGKGWIHAQYDDLSGLRAARGGMNLAIRSGLDCAERLGCTFPTRSFLNTLNLNDIDTSDEFRAAARQFNITEENMTAPRGSISVPSTPAKVRTTPKSLPDTFTGKWGESSSQIKVALNNGKYTVIPDHGEFKGRVFAEFDNRTIFDQQHNKHLLPGKYLHRPMDYGSVKGQPTWYKALLELKNTKDTSGNIIRQELIIHYDCKNFKRKLYCTKRGWVRSVSGDM